MHRCQRQGSAAGVGIDDITLPVMGFHIDNERSVAERSVAVTGDDRMGAYQPPRRLAHANACRMLATVIGGSRIGCIHARSASDISERRPGTMSSAFCFTRW